MGPFLGMESPPLLHHIAPQVDLDPPAAAVHAEDPISQLSFLDGEGNAEQNDGITWAVVMTSEDTTTSSLGTE